MSRSWRWSEYAAVSAFLPRNAEDHVTPDVARAFIEAHEDVQFEVLRVLARRSQPTGELLGMLSVMVAVYGLVITAFLHGSDGGAMALALLGIITVGAVVVVFRTLSQRTKQAMSVEWLASFERVLRKPREKPARRRWFGVS